MIRFLKISAPYPEFLAHAYASDNSLATQPYDVQLRQLMAWRFAYSDFWQRHLESTGLFEAAECLGNAVPLQRQWARENGVVHDPETREGCVALVAAQIAAFQPEVLFLHGGQYNTPEFRRRLREQVPSIRLIMAYDGIGEDYADRFVGCDVVLACLESSVAYYRKAGFHSRLVKNAFEPSMLSLGEGIPRDRSLTFLGAVTFGAGKHAQRARFLTDSMRRLEVDLHLRIPTAKQYVRSYVRELVLEHRLSAIANGVRHWQAYRQLASANHGMVCGVDMYRALARSKITLNFHIDIAASAAANMRLFEATGMGACLVTDWKPNISTLFEEDREIITFRTAEECHEKVRYLLDHTKTCAEIAVRGQQRTLRSHRLDHELADVAQWLSALC